MGTVLVTGAAGYIGSVLCERLLDEGYSVIGVDNLLYGQNGPFHLCSNGRFVFVNGDVREWSVMRGLVRSADVIIPLAAIVGAPACADDSRMAKSVNVGAIELIDELRSPRQLVVFPNTNSGYGTTDGDVYCTEEDPLNPISLYGRTKIQAEKVLLDSGYAITLRLATVFGMSPRMRLDLLVNHFTYAAVTDGYIIIYEGDFKRNYVHIRDVADCFIYCIEHPEMRNKPYNLGLDSANLSKIELAKRIKTQVPGFYVHEAQLGRDPDRRNYIVSNDRLRQAGFEARRTLDEGIRELIKGYKMMPRKRYQNA